MGRHKAWDRKNNCWYEPVHEAYKGNLHELLIGFSGDLCAHTMKGVIHESMFSKQYELLQSTEMYDKNEVEIYHSDTIKAKLSGNVGTRATRDIEGTVIYAKGCYWISEDGINPHTHLMYLYDIEITGNIFNTQNTAK